MKTIENDKIKSRPEKIMENANLAKNHGKVLEFRTFTNVSPISFEKKNVLITYTFDTQYH